MRDIVDLISMDTSLSAKAFKIANSAFYNFPCKISTIQQAVSRIGINAIRSLVLSVSFFSIKSGEKKDVFNYEQFWEQSLSGAVAAKLIMAEIVKSDWEEIFIAAKVQLQKITKELQEKNKILERLAYVDSLTEVYNHGYFQSFLEKEINLSARKSSTLRPWRKNYVIQSPYTPLPTITKNIMLRRVLGWQK
ncbi:MAG: hypothetical protein UZ01_02072 [Candidatus Brocadia sinica]|nr:MAG: hypothetical protein UZ01_02072 [Candidatus Brocadia sinica]